MPRYEPPAYAGTPPPPAPAYTSTALPGARGADVDGVRVHSVPLLMTDPAATAEMVRAGSSRAAAAASMAVLDIMERENLVAEALRLQDTLLRELSALADHPKVKDVRGGVGAVAGVQLHEPAEAMAMVKKLRAQGVSGRAAGLGTLQYSPALITTDEQVAEIAAATRRALDA